MEEHGHLKMWPFPVWDNSVIISVQKRRNIILSLLVCVFFLTNILIKVVAPNISLEIN